jgi:hypothetical protein
MFSDVSEAVIEQTGLLSSSAMDRRLTNDVRRLTILKMRRSSIVNHQSSIIFQPFSSPTGIFCHFSGLSEATLFFS